MPPAPRPRPVPGPDPAALSPIGLDGAVMLATTHAMLSGELARLAAGAGCALRVSGDLDVVRRSWSVHSAVLVGADLVLELASLGLPRRSGVHVVSDRAPDAESLRATVAVGAESVLDLTTGVGRLADLLGDLADSGRPPGLVVGVVGGSGGVGASVLTVALAMVAAASGDDAVAVDLDPRGAGLGVVAGLDATLGTDWDTLATGRGRLNSTALRESLRAGRATAPSVLGWATTSSRQLPSPMVVSETLAAARRGHDWVALDAPTPDGWPACDAIALVVAGSVHGVRAAGRVAELLPVGVPVGLAVRAPRRHSWTVEVPRALSLPSWTVLTDQRGLDEHLSAGLGPVRRTRSPLARSASEILAALGGPR